MAKYKLTRKTREKLPSFRNQYLLGIDHLHYFKPIEVDRETLRSNGLVKETIVINPLTGIVEVTGYYMLDYLVDRPLYDRKMRKWETNSAFANTFQEVYGINITQDFYSFSVNHSDRTGYGTLHMNETLNDIEIPTSIHPKHIGKYIDYSIEVVNGKYGIKNKKIDRLYPGSNGYIDRGTGSSWEFTAGNPIAWSRDAYVYIPPFTINDKPPFQSGSATPITSFPDQYNLEHSIYVNSDGKLIHKPPENTGEPSLDRDKLVFMKYTYSFTLERGSFVRPNESYSDTFIDGD